MGVLSLARTHRRDARPDASRSVRHARDGARPDRPGRGRSTCTRCRRARTSRWCRPCSVVWSRRGRDLSRFGDAAGRRSGRGRDPGATSSGDARRPRGVDVRAHGVVRRHRVRRPALRRTRARGSRRTVASSSRAHDDGGLPATILLRRPPRSRWTAGCARATRERLEPDGRLRIEGRSDEAIRTGAETVWPHEVEVALRDHPMVADVAVAGRPHEEWGQQVVAFVVPVSGDDPPTLEELREHGAERIARFKLPRAVVPMTELPRTASGKIRRGELPTMIGHVRDEGPSPGGVGSGLRSCGDRPRGWSIPRCGYRCRGVRIRVFGISTGES